MALRTLGLHKIDKSSFIGTHFSTITSETNTDLLFDPPCR